MADMTKIAEMKQDICAFLQGKQGKVCVSFYDLNAGEGFSIRGTERVPSASTIKLVILAEAMRRVREGELSLEQTITVTEEMRTGGDGILKELLPGHTFTLREILTLMIIVSDNEATNILIRMLGMDSVNRMASELGLKEACLGRLMMDSEAKKQELHLRGRHDRGFQADLRGAVRGGGGEPPDDGYSQEAAAGRTPSDVSARGDRDCP